MVKRLFFVLMLMTIGLVGAWADEVSEKDAQALAKSFVNGYFGRKGGSGPNLQGQMEKLGFYVFNMTDKGGFVIVSNESETTPILGYSETGSIELDPDKMPENMRNWLQGYADEIAWLKQHKEVIKTVSVKNAKTRSGDSKTDIGPLISTQWNQGKPYNNQTPYYGVSNNQYVYSKDYVDGYSHCATGCVATAMAQVMNYHKWPKAATSEIPAYQWHSIWLPGQNTSLSAVTFDWNNMKDAYTGNEGDNNQYALAVSTLMKYCGYSVKMNYGKESGSNTYKVANALKTYFNYNDQTVTYVQRSFYTYANWIDLIYHELKEGRPVVYGGQSSGGGHEFVCDGYLYDYENSTDLFHINWGWGGISDSYFVLSSLDPDVQGIGGSSSDDGFHYGQDAVIGIQSSEGTGTIANISTNNVDLALNSVTFSANPTQGEVVTAYIDLKNNSSDVWDGDIGIRVYYYSNNSWKYENDISSNFLIQPNTSSTICQLTFIPENSGQYGVNVYRPSETAGEITFISNNRIVLTVGSPLVPLNLSVSEITPTSAQIIWTGNSEATSYNLRYKPVQGLFYDFESAKPWVVDDFVPFTTYDGDGRPTYSIEDVEFTNRGYTGSVIAFQNGIDPNFTAHGGNAFGCFMDCVPSNEITQNNDWFITPEITISEGDVFSFWARSATSNYGLERFKVGVYDTTPGNFASYLAGGEGNTYVEAPTEWTKFSYDLSAYAGMSIKLAINCVSADAFAFEIDDLFVGNPEGWNPTIGNVTSPYVLSGLNSGTSYEVQVQAVYGNETSDWCESSFFTTPIVLNDTGNNTEVIIEAANNVVNVSLTNRTLYKDCAWNTLCLPFDMSSDQINADGSPLKDAVIKELDTENEFNFGEDGSHKTCFDEGKLYLNFKDAESIEAGKPYIVKWADTGSPIINPMFKEVTVKSTAVDNLANSGTVTLISSYDGSVSFIGTYKTQTFYETDGSILFFGVNSEGKSTLYYPKPDLTDTSNPKYPSIGAQRAYFKLSAPSAQVRGFELNFGDDEQTTGIFDIRGNIESRGANAWYDLSGRKLSIKPSAKGVYIQGGKKVVIK